VAVRPGFFVFLLLVVYVQGWQFGVPFALFLAVFTLLHELGHAVAARRTGARAFIALDFMAGYAAYVPSRPLTRGERALIAVAGPAVQVLVGSLAYLIVRGGLGWPQYGEPVQYAVLWAGPVIGLFNLLPLVPFDGGTLAVVGVEFIAPKSAERIMARFTVVASAAALVVLASQPALQGFIFFALIPLIGAVASLRAKGHTQQQSGKSQQLERSEALAWATGAVDFTRGTTPSPWFRAWQQLTSGHPDVARQVLLDDFTNEPDVRWSPPVTAPVDALQQLVALLPRPLPQGRPYADFVLAEVLLRIGAYHDAAFAAAASYTRHRVPALAVEVSRAAAALDDRATALAWLRTAIDTASASMSFDSVLDSPEFTQLRNDPEVAALVQSAAERSARPT
jgi:Zn-dependent protease